MTSLPWRKKPGLSGSSSGRLDPDTLGSLWTDREEQVFYFNVDAPAAVERAHELAEMARAHLDLVTPWLRRTRRGLDLQLRSLITGLGQLDEKAQADVTIGDELVVRREVDWTSLQGAGVEIPDQLPAELVGALDPSWSFAAMAMPLDVALHAAFHQVVAKATKRAAREANRTDRPFTRALSFLNQELGPVRSFLESEEPAVFAPGCALIQGVATDIARVSVHGGDGRERAGFGPVGRVPGLALVSFPKSASAGWKFADRLMAELAAGCGVPGKPELREADLGLGVPTAEVAWIDLQSGGNRVAFAGEMRLHWFENGRMLVLSTSTALSRAIIGRTAEASPRRLSLWARTDGAQWASLVGELGNVMQALSAPDAAGICQALGILGDFYDNHRAGFNAWQQGLRRIGTIESRDSLEDWIYREHTTIRWAH